MRADWKQLAREREWRIDGDGFWVQVGSRQHRVTVEKSGGTLLLRSRVARRAILNRISDPAMHA